MTPAELKKFLHEKVPLFAGFDAGKLGEALQRLIHRRDPAPGART